MCKTTVVLLLLPLLYNVCYCTSHTDANLTANYQFRQELHDRYTMYWSLDSETMTISFAVRVQTSGWIGFGLSPNGLMPGSDVIIGWVDQDGNSFFNDRFAEIKATPSIDESQDWFLTRAEEDGGYTVLEFMRKYYSCDSDNDLNIREGTSYIVWSFKEEDPVNNREFTVHDFDGNRRLNLLEGPIDPPADPPGTRSFAIEMNNVPVPTAHSSYWCSSFSLEEVIPEFSEQKYIIRISPVISETSAPYVHDFIIYGCPDDLNEVDAEGSLCDDASNETVACLGGVIVAAWAEHGEDFVFPKDVAFPIGGPNSIAKHVVIQMHYENDDAVSGITDNSGLQFHYTTTRRQYNAGVLEIGHTITPLMIIPPGAMKYTVIGYCTMECSNAFPESGVQVFANFLQTNSLGVEVEVRHFRRNDRCDGGYEELQVIDRNLLYDFDHQDVVYLEDEMTILPGDVLVLQCTYDSTDQAEVTLGGLKISNERCLSFLNYYPLNDLMVCLSQPEIDFHQFNMEYAQNQLNISNLQSGSEEMIASALNQLTWTPNQISSLQSASQTAKSYSWSCQNKTNVFASSSSSLLNLSTTCPYVDPPIDFDCTAGVSTISATVLLLLLSISVNVVVLSW